MRNPLDIIGISFNFFGEPYATPKGSCATFSHVSAPWPKKGANFLKSFKIDTTEENRNRQHLRNPPSSVWYPDGLLYLCNWLLHHLGSIRCFSMFFSFFLRLGTLSKSKWVSSRLVAVWILFACMWGAWASHVQPVFDHSTCWMKRKSSEIIKKKQPCQ